MPPKVTIPGPTTRDTVTLSLRAATQPGSLNAEKRTVDVTWTTGAKVKRRDWDGDYFEELSLDPSHVRMGRLNSGAPFLANHDGYDVARTLGVVESARLEGDRGVATIRFSRAGLDPAADMVFQKIQDGIVQNVSVGYRVHKFEKIDAESKTPTYRAIDWEPYEISAVAMGADEGAGFRSLTRGNQPQQEHRQMDKTPEQLAAEKAAEEKRQADIAAATERALKVERERGVEIRKLVARHKSLAPSFADELIAKGGTVDEARAAVLEKLAERSDADGIDGHPSAEAFEGSGHRIEVGAEEREKTFRGAEAALMQRYGLMDVVRQVQAKAKAGRLNPFIEREFATVASDPGEFSGMTPIELARAMLERRGVRTGKLTGAKVLDLALRANGENTTSDYATLLANLMYKTSLGQYALAEDTWREFCKTDSVQDFRPSNRYRIGSFGVLDTINEGDEYKNRSIPDGLKQAISVVTKGGMLALSRQAIINDDMGAVMATASEFGRTVGLSIEVDVYALLNANSGLGFLPDGSTPFFDATLNKNVNATGSALAVDALEADRVVLAQQKDISANEYLGLGRPGNMVLLVPIGLASQARRFNTMEFDSAQSSKFMLPNYVRGYFRTVVDSPRLTSSTRRYIFDVSQNASALVVAFLNGAQAPFMEQKLGWRTDGLEWKIRIDYQAQWFDQKLAVTNAGA